MELPKYITLEVSKLKSIIDSSQNSLRWDEVEFIITALIENDENYQLSAMMNIIAQDQIDGK